MKAVALLRYVKGYIKFSVKGGFTERFINLCATRDICIKGGEYTNGVFFGEADISGFGRLRDVARKTGVKINVVSKNGFPFYIRKNKHRLGLLIGTVFYIVFLSVMNLFVWNIQAGGSVKFSSEQLLEAAEKAGVRYGICRHFFDENKASREIYKLFEDELSWVTVNIISSKCYIEVRDSDIKKGSDDNQNKEPSNLVADFDGVILSDETYCGIKSISKGSAVREGDLLISGVMEDDYGAPIYYSAQGNFTARHNRCFDSSVLNEDEYYCFSSLNKSDILHFFGLPLKLASKDYKEEKFVITEYMQFENNTLPIGRSRIISADVVQTQLNDDVRLILIADLYTDNTYKALSSTKIISEKVDVSVKKGEFLIKGEYDCIDFIGISKPIIVENIESE